MEAAGAVSVSVFSKTIKVNASSARRSMQIAGWPALYCYIQLGQRLSNDFKRNIKQATRKMQLEKTSTFREKGAICV